MLQCDRKISWLLQTAPPSFDERGNYKPSDRPTEKGMVEQTNERRLQDRSCGLIGARHDEGEGTRWADSAGREEEREKTTVMPLHPSTSEPQCLRHFLCESKSTRLNLNKAKPEQTIIQQPTYTEAKVDVTQEIEQRAQWSAPARAACCALCSISCITSTLAPV